LETKNNFGWKKVESRKKFFLRNELWENLQPAFNMLEQNLAHMWSAKWPKSGSYTFGYLFRFDSHTHVNTSAIKMSFLN